MSAGAVRLDGDDIRNLPRDALRARLGYVEQEAPVLAGTLRENLLITTRTPATTGCARSSTRSTWATWYSAPYRAWTSRWGGWRAALRR
ncbi:hypothetical protein NKG94_07640 [Micromonospora sp. M12]